MTTFQILWIIAGFFLGFWGIDLIGATVGARFSLLSNVIAGFIGSLITYTILR